MSNKTQLQTNNASLDNYIARINAAKEVAASLPEAGGGSVEVWTGTVYGARGLGDMPETIYYYTDETSTPRSITLAKNEFATITILANTYIILHIGYELPTWIEEPTGISIHEAIEGFLPTQDNFEISYT